MPITARSSDISVIAAVGDVEDPAWAHCHAVRLVELGFWWVDRPVRLVPFWPVPATVDRPVAGTIDPDAVVLGVGDQHVSLRVDAKVLRAVEPGLAGVAAVSRVARFAGAGDGADLPASIDDPKCMPAALENI